MIVVMRKDCTRQQLEAVKKVIEGHGLGAHLLEGVERTVVGVVGQTFPELKDELVLLAGVLEVVPISKPNKLSSREFKKEDTVVKVGDVSIGGGELVVMAGPCAVEDEEQLISTALAVKEAGATVLRGGAFKPRSSPYSFRGLGVQGLQLLAKARKADGHAHHHRGDDTRGCGHGGPVRRHPSDRRPKLPRTSTSWTRWGKSKKPVLLKRGFASTYEEWLLCAPSTYSPGATAR